MAIGSLLFGALMPAYGIMHCDLSGDWRGVFSHKEPLGSVMAVGVFVELYLLALPKLARFWSIARLSAYFSLIVLSGSATALVLSMFYFGSACIYLLWVRNKTLGLLTTMAMLLIFTVASGVFMLSPDLIWGLLGRRDMTGRLGLWPYVWSLFNKSQ